jgi:hypothetical protein
MEERFGHDFSRVLIHTDERAAASARAVAAHAYTVGRHVVFDSGRYAPETPFGRHLLAHELTHVLQQQGRPASGVPPAVRPARDPWERESEEVARRVTARSPASTPVPVRPVEERGLQRQDADPIEVGSFTPVAGITVDRTGTHMHIAGTLEATGPEASAANAAAAQATIRKYWNQTFADGYRVTCDVTVRYRAPGTPPSGVAEIWMERVTGPSHVNTLTDTMTLNMNGANALTWTVAHEFGHQLGLQDRYSESILSMIAGTFGGARTTTPHTGYAGTIMAESGGATQSQTVRDIGVENAPSTFADDDQIRLWVSRHGAAEIGALSTATKIQMINTLLDGWISDEDVATIGSICAAVTSSAESTAVKRALSLRLLDMTSIGQRTRVRVFMAGMP